MQTYQVVKYADKRRQRFSGASWGRKENGAAREYVGYGQQLRRRKMMETFLEPPGELRMQSIKELLLSRSLLLRYAR